MTKAKLTLALNTDMQLLSFQAFARTRALQGRPGWRCSSHPQRGRDAVQGGSG